MNILILGAGAIGCLVGGKLAQSGHAVTLVGRERFVTAIHAHGLQMRIGETTEIVRDLRAVDSIHAAFWHAAEEKIPYDVAILTVKSYDTATALTEIASAVEANRQPLPAILSLQNGVGNEEAIAARFGADRVIAGAITAPVEVPEAGMIHVAKPKFVVGLARWEGLSDGSLLARVEAALSESGIRVTRYADARSMKWTKLLMNMIGNATSAILGQPPGVTFADQRVADLEVDALREALSVMRAAGIHPVDMEKYPLGRLAPLIQYAPKAILRPALRRIVGGARGGKMPSLYLDLEKGKRANEVDWLNGAVVRMGQAVGIATPTNQWLNQTVQHLAQHPEERAQWQGNTNKLGFSIWHGR
ncbi:MAG: 2-dehydropantoate 2-reductase [Caldilineaceae bacterium]|nr:2-dehydropantoate 2-reductase [Caldilineaceae bacterium]